MENEGILSELRDDFGPTLYATYASVQEWKSIKQDELQPIILRADRGGIDWLKQALRNVNTAYVELEVSEEDFEAVKQSEWEPIPVDRNNPALQRADEAIKDVIEAAEGDNGYAVHAPDERDYVISNLKSFRTLVQEQKTIYALQIKTFVLDPLGRVGARFGTAALGLTAEAAKKAVVDWIKSHFGKLFDWLF